MTNVPKTLTEILIHEILDENNGVMDGQELLKQVEIRYPKRLKEYEESRKKEGS